jgi:hemerythrin superfamily protein
MAKKKATKAKAAKKSKAKTAKAKASKRVMPRRTKTKAAKKRVAARATASRKAVPEKKQSTLTTAGNIARGAAAIAVATIAKRLPWAKDENDPIELLKTDHRRFEKLLEDGEATTERAIKGRGEILDALTSELTVHEAIEEQILYPALRPHTEAHHIVLEGIEEHHVADVLIKELHKVRKDNEKWGAKFGVLKESITHHIKEEERMMFPAARAALAREELLALGARMRTLKTELEK